MKSKTTLIAWLLTIAIAMPFAWLVDERLDMKIVDKQFRLLRQMNGPMAIVDDPVLVGVDQQTYTEFEWPLGLWHPYIGQFLSAMAASDTRGVILDVVMPQKPVPQTMIELADRGQLTYHDDILLISAIELHNKQIPLVIAEAPDETGSRIIRGYSDLLSVLDSLDRIDSFFGMAQVHRDEDGIHRRYLAEVGGRPTLAAQMAKRLGASTPDRTDEGMINYLLGDNVDYIPMQQVTRWFADNNVEALKAAFAGRIVFLGAVTTTQDRKPLPLRLFSPQHDQAALLQPGVMLHLQALRSYLNGGLIERIGFALVLLVGLLTTLCWWLASRVRYALLCLIGVGGVLLVGSTMLLQRGVFFPPAFPLAMLYSLTLGRLLYEALLAFRDRQRLKASFSGYVSPAVMASILSGDIAANRNGEMRRVCVLFSDIRQFTTRSENAQPDSIIRLLNRYFEHMVGCVHHHGGTVDKFMGDGLMAFFGAPNALDSPAQKALDAAAAMLDKLHALNRELTREGIENIQIGIGLHVGEVVVGHVGSSGRHEYTAIGDTVNAAARLEDLTRETGYPVVFSKQVGLELEQNGPYIDLGFRPLKGRSDMHVYALDRKQP